MQWNYSGPVVDYFGKVIATSWRAQTTAPTKERAISNFKYKFKKENGIVPNARIELPGVVYQNG